MNDSVFTDIMNGKQEIFHSIKSTICSFLPDARVLLFGSQAHGTQRKGSDYDILVIIKQTLSSKEKINWIGKIHRSLVYLLDAPVDVLLDSEEEVKQKQKLPGHILQWAVKEGKEL